jgi:hypothetical protein
MRTKLIVMGTLIWAISSCTLAAPLPPPFDTAPVDTNIVGNTAFNMLGAFRRASGQDNVRYFLGTEDNPGTLIMDFLAPFGNGPGNDFAILTNSTSWGPLADTARFEFFLGGVTQGSFTASLGPDILFQFDLPGSDVVADRIVVTNITPDPPGINNLAGMTFDNTGVAYVVPEPSGSALLLMASAVTTLSLSSGMLQPRRGGGV